MNVLSTFCGKVVKIDEEDYERLKGLRLNWMVNAVRVRHTKGTTAFSVYVIPQKEGCIIDHINRDPLDFRKENLRNATKQQNSCNQGIRQTNTSGYKGVSWHKRRKKWQANICVNYKNMYLGIYNSCELAALAYNEAARKYHGNFAFINEI